MNKEKSLKGHRVLAWLLMTLCLVWYQVTGFSGAFAVQADFLAGIPLERFCFMISSFIGAFICVFADSFLVSRHKLLAGFVPTSLLVGVVLYVLAPYQMLLSQQILSSVGSFVMGFCFVWVFVQYMSLFRGNGSLWEYAVIQVVAQVTMVLVLDALFRFTSPVVQTVLVFVFTVALIVVLALARRVFSKNDTLQKSITLRQAAAEIKRSEPYQFRLGLLVAVTVAVGVLRATSQDGFWGEGRSSGAQLEFWQTLLLVLAFLLVGLTVFYLFMRPCRQGRRQIPYLILLASLLILVAYRPEFGTTEIYGSVKISVELYGQTLYMLSIIVVMRSLPYSSYRIIGFAQVLSYMLALVCSLLFERYLLPVNLVILAASFVLVLALSRVELRSELRIGRAQSQPITSGNEEGAVETDIYAELTKNTRALATEYGLTQRESEILILLVQGRNLPHIKQRLVISESTVRTHIKRIYQKLGIHSRQELLDLLT